jgi:hypothetical protein
VFVEEMKMGLNKYEMNLAIVAFMLLWSFGCAGLDMTSVAVLIQGIAMMVLGVGMYVNTVSAQKTVSKPIPTVIPEIADIPNIG